MVTKDRLSVAKWQAKYLFCKGGAAAQRIFYNHAARKYRCKASQITFDDTGALKRIAEARVCYDDDSILGRTDGHSIEIACVCMTHAEIVGTLIHEAMHDWCKVKGKSMSCVGEHYCMGKCGDPNECA